MEDDLSPYRRVVRTSRRGGIQMADYYINIFLEGEKLKQIEDAGLADQIQEIDGKKAVQVDVNRKEQKKLAKGFPDMSFDASNACVLPAEAEKTLMGFITNNKSLDVMKFAILKLYNPLAGRGISGRGTGGR
jgi:hypothetical protein